VQNKLTIPAEVAEELATAANCREFTFVHIEFLGEWRWGNEYQVVFMNSEGYWAFDYKESVGDQYWSSISSTAGVVCYSVERIEVTTYKYEKIENG
jgi:hypothetical protein